MCQRPCKPSHRYKKCQLATYTSTCRSCTHPPCRHWRRRNRRLWRKPCRNWRSASKRTCRSCCHKHRLCKDLCRRTPTTCRCKRRPRMHRSRCTYWRRRRGHRQSQRHVNTCHFGCSGCTNPTYTRCCLSKPWACPRKGQHCTRHWSCTGCLCCNCRRLSQCRCTCPASTGCPCTDFGRCTAGCRCNCCRNWALRYFGRRPKAHCNCRSCKRCCRRKPAAYLRICRSCTHHLKYTANHPNTKPHPPCHSIGTNRSLDCRRRWCTHCRRRS